MHASNQARARHERDLPCITHRIVPSPHTPRLGFTSGTNRTEPNQIKLGSRGREGGRNRGRIWDFTLVEKPIGGLVGIHVAFAEHGVDLLVGVAARDLLDVLDRPPHRRRDRNPSRRHILPPRPRPRPRPLLPPPLTPRRRSCRRRRRTRLLLLRYALPHGRMNGGESRERSRAEEGRKGKEGERRRERERERERRERKRRWGERERERDLWEGFVGGREGREGRNACVARWLWGLTLHYTTGVYKNGGGATDGRIFFVFQTFFYSFIYI